MKRPLTLILGLLLLTSCSSTDQQSDLASLETPARYSGLKLEDLGSYHASFLLQFAGNSPWSYQVDVRSDGELMERSLHIEGVDPVQNPGDVRMVSQGEQNRLAGQVSEDLGSNVLVVDPSDD